MSLIVRLTDLMMKKGINRHQLSKETGIPYSTIASLYDKGFENIKLSTLKKLADYFGCSLDYLVDDDVQSRLNFEDASDFIEQQIQSWEAEENAEIQEFITKYKDLNGLGRSEAMKRINEMTRLKEYQKHNLDDDF